MKSSINLKRILYCLIGISLCLFAAGLSYRGYMNYQGYCWEEQRYISTEEKIRRVVEDVLKQYPPLMSVEKTTINKVTTRILIDEALRKRGMKAGSEWEFWRPDKSVFYKNVEDFLQMNPKCCELSKKLAFDQFEGPTPTLIDQLTGSEFEFAWVRYWVHYIENDQPKSVQVNYYAGLSSCGYPHATKPISYYD